MKCSKWYHRLCTKIGKTEFDKRLRTGDTEIVCTKCKVNDSVNVTKDKQMKIFPCGKCFKPTKNTNSIGCDGPCGTWFHQNCSGLTSNEYKTHTKTKDRFGIVIHVRKYNPQTMFKTRMKPSNQAILLHLLSQTQIHY